MELDSSQHSPERQQVVTRHRVLEPGRLLALCLALAGCSSEVGSNPPADMSPVASGTQGTMSPAAPGMTPGVGTGDGMMPAGPVDVVGPGTTTPVATGPGDNPGPSNTPVTPDPVTPTPADPLAACNAGPEAPRSPLRRITRFEYNNSVRDLFGIADSPADALPGEEAGSGFGNDADALGVSRLLTDGYRAVAQQVATEILANPAKLIELVGCDPTLGDAACQQTFLEQYLMRVFRKPADAADLSAYQAAFEQGVELGGDSASGVQAVIERSLQSPQFLYRVELGSPDAATGLAKPTGYEMATRLSYLFWSSTPDPELLAAAAQGQLDTSEGVLEQARRMLDDDKAKDSLRYFHGQLFGISGLDFVERDTGIYPAFKPGMGALFRQETERFLEHVVFEEQGNLATVLTAPYTFVNGPLAEFYGISGVTGDAFQQVPVDTTKRMGLLTQASIMMITTPGNRTDPVVRGKWLYTKVLCGVVPDPPMNVPLLPEPEPGQSVRERLAQHREDPACSGCHQLMDPVGLPFEHFDGVGQWRDTDNGAEIDVTGEIPISDVKGPFEGALEFAQKVAQSADARECYVGRYMTYAYGRALNDADDCSRAKAEVAFHAAEGNIKELMLAVTQTDGFQLRAVVNPGQ